MRKATKRLLLDIIKTLYEAHGIIQKHINNGAYENAFNLLEECQNTAIKLGNSIEETEGENFASVRYFEIYCDTSVSYTHLDVYKRQFGHRVRQPDGRDPFVSRIRRLGFGFSLRQGGDAAAAGAGGL